MSNVYVIDNDFLDKLAKIEQLEALRLEGNKIIVTDKVYVELVKGAGKNAQSAVQALEWLKSNQGQPWLELAAPTQTPSGKINGMGMGERSIINLVNERKALDPSINFTILSDNKNDYKKITAALNDPSTELRYVKEFAIELSNSGYMTGNQYTALLHKMDVLLPDRLSEPRPQFASLLPTPPSLAKTNAPINDFDLTPDELKKQHETAIKKVNTFEPQGVSEQAAKNFLDTPNGEKYFQQLRDAAPNTPITELRKRAVGHLMSGSELPRVEIINEPLVKIVPHGQTPSPYSPFWAKEADLDAAVTEGKNLSKHFGLPVGSEALGYDVYKITPKAPTEVFVGRLAPTVELDGLIQKSGGAMQYLTPNRQLYEDATFVKSVENRIFIPHQKELQIPSDLKNPAIQTIGGVSRADLAAMSDELTSRHGYTPAKVFEAANARVTLNSAVEDFKAGKGLNTSDEVLRSQAIVRQTTTVMSDSVANAAQVETMNRQFTAYTSAVNQALPEVVKSNFEAIDKPVTQTIKPNTQSSIDLTPTAPKTTNPHNGYTQQFNQISAVEDAFAQEAHAAKQAEQASKRIERQHLSNEPIKSIQLEVDIKNGIKAETQIAKALSQSEHLAAGLESGLSKVAGKALVGVGLVDAGITIRHDVKEAVRTANNNQEEWTKGTAALSKGVMQESGVDLAISAVDAASRLNPLSTVERMVRNQTLNPFTGIVDEAQKNAQAREEAYTKFGETTGNSLYNTFSKEGGARAEAEKLTQALPNITDPEGRRNAEILRDAFAETAHNEHIKNQNRIAGVHGVMNSYDDFIAQNPRYSDISKDNAVDEANKLTGNGMAAGQAVSTGYNNLKQQLDIENAERLAKLSEADRQATLKVMERNPSASVRTASELVELANNRGMTTMGGAPIGENMYKAALAKMEEANHKADPTYGKDANDIRLQQQIEQAKAAEQAHQQLLKAVEKLDLDSKIGYYQAKAVEQRKDPNHFAHPHDAASNVVHLQYQKKQQMEAQGHTNYRAYGKQAEHNQSNGAQHRPAPKPAELGMGASGQKVTNLQNVLKSLGADIVVDGHFGSTTRDAVKEFQREHNLKVDGKIGLNDAKVIGQAVQAKDAQQAITTLAQLNQRGMHLTDKKDSNNTSSNDNSAAIQTLQDAKPKTYNLKQGAQGEQVHQIQLALNQLGHNVPTDGLFDKTIQEAVKAFQKEYGLQPDGAMNPKDTWQLAQAVDNHQRVQAQLVEQKQSISPTQSITTPTVNQPDVTTPAAPAVSPEQSKQVEQMVSALSTNPAFAALAPDVQMTMAAQAVAVQAVNPNAQSETQPTQSQTATAQVQNTPEPIAQTAAPSVSQAEPQPIAQATAPTQESVPTLSRTQQSHVDLILERMAQNPDFTKHNHEQKTAMAMGLMIEAHQRGEPMDKLQGVYLPLNGTTLAAQFDTPIGIVHLPTADALKATPQQLLEAYQPQPQPQQVLEQLQQQLQNAERDGIKGMDLLNPTQQGYVNRVLERMAENPDFTAYPLEQKNQMAIGLTVAAIKQGEPMDKLQGVYLPLNGIVLAAQFDTPIGIVHLPTQEALQAKPQDVVVAQQEQIVQQQQQEQQRAIEREQSQGRGISL